MFLKFLARLLGVSSEAKIKHLYSIVQHINSFEEDIKKLSDSDLAAKTVQFRNMLAQGASLDDLLPEAFACIREASSRTIGLRHFDVQMLGGIILHQGKVAEMKTGEGKTLVATLPIYLNALTGKGCHLVTVNDYLARRDSTWMSPVYKFMGLSVGTIQNDMDSYERREQYACDITYGTNNEFGFDYLRDNMAVTKEQCVQRELNFAIVDEVDNILIDEARTPLIISGMLDESVDHVHKTFEISKKILKGSEGDPNCDYYVSKTDMKHRTITVTDKGMQKIEKLLGIDSTYEMENIELVEFVKKHLVVKEHYHRDQDYIVKDGEIIIVDEFTGRLMTGRRYSEGLHQAIEKANEALLMQGGGKIRSESQTLATITFQNYFRLYNKLAGMTGTALTEEAELGKIYNLEVAEIPTHRKMIRVDHADVIYKTKKEKFTAIADEIAQLHKIEKPVLVGTISIENSELLSTILKRRGIQHHVLNAKQHEKEAEIVAKAGQKKAVTIATNMAGRGTDIVLGEGVVGLGGLHIIGSERHESRRIDNQLRGRSGRQGDPGSSRFYVSLEDDLMRLFGSDRIKGIMERLGMEEGTPIEHGLISKALENAQRKVEQYHFSIRKQILEYDDVMNKQREAIYGLRKRILQGDDLEDKFFEMVAQIAEEISETFMPQNIRPDEWDTEGLKTEMAELACPDFTLPNTDKAAEARAAVESKLKSRYEERKAQLGREEMSELQRFIMLKVMDDAWIEQLHNMDALRDGIGLRAWGERDPLIEYKMEAFGMFNEMMSSARKQIFSLLFKVQLVSENESIAEKARNITYGAPQTGESKKQPVTAGAKVGRNDPCPCGSGKKYKKCCGK